MILDQSDINQLEDILENEGFDNELTTHIAEDLIDFGLNCDMNEWEAGLLNNKIKYPGTKMYTDEDFRAFCNKYLPNHLIDYQALIIDK